jgi:hypothetical protein
MPLTRISITVPRDLVTAADRRARQLDRSRSWVVAEALRAWLRTGGRRELGAGSRPATAVREPGPVYAAPRRGEPPTSETPVDIAAEVAAARRRHLAAELAWPPAERLRRAEELARLARAARPRGPRAQVIGFDSYEDFYEWKKARLVGA